MDIHEGETPSPTENQTPATTTDTTATPQGATPDANTNPAEPPSSPENDAKAKPEQSLSSVVEAALKGKGATSPSEKPPVDTKSKAGGPDPKKPEGQKGEGGEAEIPREFHKHPAWQRLKGERDEARQSAERYKADAEEFGAITGFMQQHSISAEQVANIMHLIVLQNNDPAKFYEVVAGFKDELDQRFGHVLPEDLKARVANGEISEDDAKELSKTRATNKLLQETAQAKAEREAKQSEADAAANLRKQMATTVNQWEQSILAKDPDYGRKQRLVQAEIRAYIQQYGMPKDPQMALKYATTAYEEVTKHLQGILPEKRPNTPTPQTGRQTETTFVPKSLEDVVSHALTGGG